MRLLFWISLALVWYAYMGYPLLLWLIAKRRPVRRATWAPRVSIVMAAHNEQENLPRKLANIRAQLYDPGLLQTIVVSDGSTDRTVDILREAASGVDAIILPVSVGKAQALNLGVQRATGEVLILLDTRQVLDSNAIAELVSCLADPSVGAVSGELLLESADGLPSSDGLGVYWKIEKFTRRLESSTGSVVGVTGAIYALRRELYQPIPPGTLLDDVLIPMQVARQGGRVIFHGGAVARDRIFAETGREFGRKVRTLTGNYQMLRLAPWLLSPANPLLFRLFSHKLIRLLVPWLLAMMVITSALLPTVFFRSVFLLQLVFYAIALLGYFAPGMRRQRAVSLAYTFSMLNAAAAMAFFNFVGRRTRWS